MNKLIDAIKKQSYSRSIDTSNDSEVLFHISKKNLKKKKRRSLPFGIDAAKSSDKIYHILSQESFSLAFYVCGQKKERGIVMSHHNRISELPLL